MHPNLLDLSVTVVCISVSFLSYAYQKRSTTPTRSKGYILHNSVTHARHLPTESAHAFTYPTLSLLVSLRALENGDLDLGKGWIFGYGGLWGRLTGLRSKPYLTSGTGTIKQKLADAVRTRGLDTSLLEDAWMMTMPSFLGVEGINPLTVYFAYDAKGRPTLVVLEIHNTFGESHLHVLQLGVNEDPTVDHGYDHQWTFRREFHVSPFNDRSGFYRISVQMPSHSPMLDGPNSPHNLPKPVVRVHLYTAATDDDSHLGDLKLRALLRPVSAAPLTSPSLLLALLRTPFGLLLTMPRILFMAWKLHYQKRLDVFLRPDPLPASIDFTSNERTKDTVVSSSGTAGGVKWLEEGPLERFARRRTESFLKLRAEQIGMDITLVHGDPNIPKFKASPSQGVSSALTISYTSSRFFTTLFTSPSAAHALLLGCDVEEVFTPSSRDTFVQVFSSTPLTHIGPSTLPQRLRTRPIPSNLGIPTPTSHFLDRGGSIDSAVSLLVLFMEQLSGCIEKQIFSLVHARIVEGTEPWTKWERAALFLSNKGSDHDKNFDRRNIRVVGSVRRP